MLDRLATGDVGRILAVIDADHMQLSVRRPILELVVLREWIARNLQHIGDMVAIGRHDRRRHAAQPGDMPRRDDLVAQRRVRGQE